MRDNRTPQEFSPSPEAKSILGKLDFLFLFSRDPYCVCDRVGCAEAILR